MEVPEDRARPDATEPVPAHPAAPAPGVATLADATRKTYRYLRVSVVAMGLLLAASLVVEMLRRDAEQFGSISGYYYSPARSVFVGALVAIGPALVAIKGRSGWEDTLLDLAGMVIPLVALVPTPRDLGPEVCGPGRERCVPPELVPAVENNVTALAVLGVAGLTFAWWSAGSRRTRADLLGLLAATGLAAVVVLWFVVWRESFLSGAHYAAAVLFFGLIAAVAYLNGRSARDRCHVRVLTPARFGGAYRTISVLMVLTIVVAGVLLVLGVVLGVELPFATVFVVEAVLLVLFVVFWVLQTAENWDEEAVEEEVAGS